MKKAEKEADTVRVWDPLVRFFHWSLVAGFTIAYFSGEDFITLHSWAGYFILTLIVIRIVWGFVGSRHALFSDFVYRPATIKEFMKDTLRAKAKRYLGHNPAGGAMVILLMLSIIITGFTRMMVLGAEDQAGPLASWFTGSSDVWGEFAEETHEFFANFTVFLVLLHVIGVFVESLIHKENLISSMITGYKRARSDQ